MADSFIEGDAAAADKALKDFKPKAVAPVMETIFLDLPPHADRVVLDGRIYFTGREYTVTPEVASVFREQMARGWDYEEKRREEDDYGFGAVRRHHTLSGKARRR